MGFERVEVTEQAMEEVRVAEAMGAAWAWRRMRAFEEDSVDAGRACEGMLAERVKQHAFRM